MAMRSFRRISLHSRQRCYSFCAKQHSLQIVPPLLTMDKPPDNRTQCAQPEQDARAGLNLETQTALVGRLRIALEVEDPAEDPDETDRRCDRIADINRKQPE